MAQAIYAGSFDPITNGHIDIAKRATKLFDKIIIAVAEKKSEKTLLDIDERVLLIKDVFSDTNNITVISFDSLVLMLSILSFSCSIFVAPIILLVTKGLSLTKPNANCVNVRLCFSAI